MRILGNIIWHVPCFGFFTAICTAVSGVAFTITVVGAPIGLGLLEFSKFLLWPFGNAMVNKDDLNIEQNEAWKTYSTVVKIVYFPFGLLLSFLVIIQMIFMFVSIVGIPAALVLAKSLSTYLNPVNKKCVSVAVIQELEKRKNQKDMDKYLGQNSE